MKTIKTSGFRKIAFVIDPKTRDKVNMALIAAGFDENKPFKTPGDMLGALQIALAPFNLIPQNLGYAGTPSADLSPEQIGEAKGKLSVELTTKTPSATGDDNPFDPGEQVEGSTVELSWIYKPEIDAYKALAYLS